MDPERFRGDPDGYRQWVAEHPSPFNPTWCSEHWAPCPVGGKPGMLATIILTTESFSLLPPDIRDMTGVNSWWANQTTSACCQFGDEKTRRLWAFVDLLTETAGVCGAPPPQMPKFNGRHTCWLAPDHDGRHDWLDPVRSIFDYPQMSDGTIA